MQLIVIKKLKPLKINTIFKFQGGLWMNINKKIIKKIRDSNLNPYIENFLKDILFFELQHYDEARPNYSEKYEELINKYLNKYEVEGNED